MCGRFHLEFWKKRSIQYIDLFDLSPTLEIIHFSDARESNTSPKYLKRSTTSNQKEPKRAQQPGGSAGSGLPQTSSLVFEELIVKWLRAQKDDRELKIDYKVDIDCANKAKSSAKSREKRLIERKVIISLRHVRPRD